MQLEVISLNGQPSTTVELSKNIFDRQFNEPLVHQVVTACLAGQRQGTHKQKTRAEVRGGGIKPWKQKGSGRARAGTIRSPLWRHGGVTFAAVPGNYAQKINKKMYKGAMLSIISQALRNQHIRVIEEFNITEPKTKAMLALFKQLDIKKPLIILEDFFDKDNILLSARNIPHVEFALVNALNPVSLLAHDHILMTKSALLKLNEVYANE